MADQRPRGEMFPLSLFFFLGFTNVFGCGSVNAEFMRINVMPLESRFFSQLDKLTENLMKVFRNKGGVAGKKIHQIMTLTTKRDDIRIKRDCVLKSLCVYLNEDSKPLKEFSVSR
ncbi:unnamed protein product [Menidia menidia]|uniref:(Atlantic silverside) hypothetical protein n=1 Tax=Menidia menidia TaxID=238744 RepID=A0A8S4BGZ6_9TELE|nr:unnamed protein product [Menidia menidia]